MKCPSVMQKSARNGSQIGSGVNVLVGVTVGRAVGLGEGIVAVALDLVLTTTTGVSVTPVVAQDTKISGKSRFLMIFRLII
jgi:hypothetical protein